ncbi:histone deacetylase 9-like isoform X3 [Anguilla anguilla]|uniref:histone deacetylase 9-like isoform X3 n=1 Tax=Anguilla anguilla TaxID=7936 RepID=UPI0015B20A17|nr:histone deacetylase 9-like isoform X3 [Anguilla anguilla]
MKNRAERRRLVHSAHVSPQRPHYHWPVNRSVDTGLAPYPPATLQHTHWGFVEIKPEVQTVLEPVSPLDLRTDVRMLGPGTDPSVWEKQLQQELLLIQKQQQIQKQLLITEFQKQHENLTRQHQAQLQEHLKLQQELLVMKQKQELLEKERKLEQQSQEQELERHRREQHILILRSKERARESAVASTEVKQKLQEFLLSKSTKDPGANGVSHPLGHHPKLWYTAAHHTSLDQSSPPLGGTSPTYKYTLPSSLDNRNDFPLRKTASEPNLKVRSRLKQKVAERRSSPLMRRKDGSVITPFKKRTLEFIDSTVSSSAPGSGPSSPNGASSALGAENGPSSLPTTTQTERWPTHQRVLKPEESMTLLSLYTSPSLPNITLGLPAVSSSINAAMALKEKQGDGRSVTAARPALPSHFLGTVPLQPGLAPVALETKVNSSHQALLQHLLLKEQMRQQKILSTGPGSTPVLPQSPLAMKERPASSVRHKLPRHRPLNRTQSAPLPQSTLAQLVIQQQHQHFLEKQKQYQQQVHINKMLSKSIEQLRQPNAHPQESEEEDTKEQPMQEDRVPPSGVIRNGSQNNSSSSSISSISSSSSSSSDGELPGSHLGVIKVKEEPPDSEDEGLANQSKAATQSTYLHQEPGCIQQFRWYQAQLVTVMATRVEAKPLPGARVQPPPLDSPPRQHTLLGQAGASAHSTGLVYDAGMLKHQCVCDNYANHLEHAGRVQSIWARLQDCGLVDCCERILGRKASLEEVRLVHSERHTLLYGTNPLNRQKLDPKKLLGSTPQDNFTVLPCGGYGVDSDTVWNELHSSTSARTAVGCVIELASRVASGGLENGFAVVRPPGHHAEESTAMGFCFFNSIAIAAKYLRQKLNVARILIVDWDVHHGNGTQQAFYADPAVLYVSLHRYDEGNFFPGSGAPDERGSGLGEGYNVNIAWTGGLDPPMGDVEYLAAFRTIIIPLAHEFDPDVVLVSAGFDAMEGHEPPLGGYKVTAKCFSHLTRQLMQVARGRVVLALEGGHDLGAICDASEACVNALLGNELEPLSEDVLHAKPNANGVTSITKTIQVHSKHWKCLKRYSPTVDLSLAEALSQEKDETEAVRAMSLLSVDVNLSSKPEEVRAAPEPMDEEPVL